MSSSSPRSSVAVMEDMNVSDQEHVRNSTPTPSDPESDESSDHEPEDNEDYMGPWTSEIHDERIDSTSSGGPYIVRTIKSVRISGKGTPEFETFGAKIKEGSAPRTGQFKNVAAEAVDGGFLFNDVANGYTMFVKQGSEPVITKA